MQRSEEKRNGANNAHVLHKTREAITTLAELRKRLIYQGELSVESAELYNQIEHILHEAIGGLYGWSEEQTTKTTDKEEAGCRKRRDTVEPQRGDDH